MSNNIGDIDPEDLEKSDANADVGFISDGDIYVDAPLTPSEYNTLVEELAKGSVKTRLILDGDRYNASIETLNAEIMLNRSEDNKPIFVEIKGQIGVLNIT